MSIGRQMRRGTAALWTSTNSVLLAGQFGYETDTSLLKVGDGSTAWNSLPYIAANASTAATANKVALRDGSAGLAIAALTATAATFQDGILQRAVPNIRTATGTTDTLLAADNLGIIRYTSASAVTLTLPNNLVAGFNCTIYQRGAGQITWSPASGATAISGQGFVKSAANGAAIHLFVETNSGTNASYLVSGYGV